MLRGQFKKESLFLIYSLFFLTTLIVNLIHNSFEGKPFTFGTGVFNIILSTLSFVMYKVKYKNVELIVTLILIPTLLVKMFVDKSDIIDMTILIVYSSFLILKQVKVSIISVSSIIASLFIFNAINMINENGSIARSINNTLLTIVVISTLGFIHIKELTLTKDISKKYNLTKDEYRIIKKMYVPQSPSNKELAYSLNIAYSTLTKHLDTIYDKFSIESSGNRKVDLMYKLANEGFI